MDKVKLSLLIFVFILGLTGCNSKKEVIDNSIETETINIIEDNVSEKKEDVVELNNSIVQEKTKEPIIIEQNSVVTEYAGGQEVSVDLDGDGKEEKVYYGEDDFRINGVSYAEVNEDDFGVIDNSKGIDDWLFHRPSLDFRIVDIDKSDKQKEIVLYDAGPSDDPCNYIYTYNNGLVKVGEVSTYIANNSFDGKGNMKGRVGSYDGLQKCFLDMTWKLENNKIVEKYSEVGYYNDNVLNEELPIKENITDEKENLIIKPQTVKIRPTEKENYFYIEGEDGTKGYFEVIDGGITALGNKDRLEVFPDLAIFD